MSDDRYSLGSGIARDGGRVAWERVGMGPALVVVHGGGRAGKHYRLLAEALADRFTVILLDRRGRGHSAPAQPTDDLALEVGDLGVVLEATGAQFVFGHSAGAVISLAAALRLPIRKLAVYEPPLLNDTGLPLDWLPRFEEALRQERPARAFLLSAKGLQMGVPDWIPNWLAELPLKLMMRGDQGRETAALLGTLPRDISLLQPTRAADFSEIRCPTLLLSGSESPAYIRSAAKLLGATIPEVRCQELPGVGHNAPDLQAPGTVAAELAAFFAAPERITD